jgi:lipid-A-disaccharide synthase
MEIFFSVGEPSGDQHAAHLIESLKARQPGLRCVGYGGPEMQKAGCTLHYRLTDLAVMGLFRVLPLLWQFIRLVRRAGRYLRESRPDAVVLVDFPGFNWWIARKAKKAGIPVIYYLPPQIWAWASWRVKRLKRLADKVLCGLPFEQEWYRERGLDVEFVGHPFFDEVAGAAMDEDFLEGLSARTGPRLALLPGSRNQEVERNWPVMIEIVRRLQARHPGLSCVVANYNERQLAACREVLAQSDTPPAIDFYTGKTSEIIEWADCCLMVSGSVSLELLARATPAVVMYRASWLMEFVGHRIITCDYITLVNLIAGREVMPEFPFSGWPEAVPTNITEILGGWIGDPQACAAVRRELQDLRDNVCRGGATDRAAEAILGCLPGEEHRAAA